MAYASLISVEQTTDLILNHHKYSISVGERQQISSIREYVIFLIPFLESFPEKANRFEGKIRDLANEAEDLIEMFMWSQFQLGWSVGLPNYELEGRLKRVSEEIGSITGDMMDDRLCNLPAAILSSSVADTCQNDVVMGLGEDLIEIKGRLCGESSKLEVIPIVGMGGIGKTTLARYAFDDPLMIERFDIRAWVTVSQNYSVDEIPSRLLASMKLFEKNKRSMAEKVYKSLKGKRYVIVMDDIWSTEAWDVVRNIFPDDNNGSRIVLTTRLSDVAAYASSGSPFHEMKFMEENQSWDLIKKKVFTTGEDCPHELKNIGKAIARGCRGLPLAVVLVAGIMSTIDKTKASWEKIAENVNSAVEGQLDKILSLSYTFLPHHLRPCFLLMGGFPEDYSFHASRLIKLWVAEGFSKRQNGRKTMEEEAEGYLEDLAKRSLVLITSRKINGKIKRCSLHDLVRDMCIRKAREEKFLLTGRDILSDGGIDVRRISIRHCSLDEIWSPTIRTILCFPPAGLESSSLAFLVSFRLLRVLEIMHNNLVFLPSQLFELFNLRYLALGKTNMIPAAISKLVNLQTLIIHLMVSVVALTSFPSDIPLEIWRMQQLRHLVLGGYYRLLNPLDGSTLPLENLQTLSFIPSSACSKRILKMIPNLKKVGIICYGYEEHHDLLNLVNLHQLEKLKIRYMVNWQTQCPAFPKTLTRLALVGGKLPWEDMSIVGSLPNLQVLKLKNHACEGDTWETKDGEFTELKFLLIENLNLRYWITERDHFPRLKFLVLRCAYLREIPDDIGEIPTLEVIEVDARNQSLLNSAKRIQEDQQSYGNDALQVRSYNNKRAREEIGSITGDMMDDRLCDLPAAILSSSVVDTSQNDVVMGLG